MQETVPPMHTLQSIAGNENVSSNFGTSSNLASRLDSEANLQTATKDASQQDSLSFFLPSLDWQISLEPPKVSTSLLYMKL